MRELSINRIHDYPPKPEDANKGDVYLNGKTLYIVTSNKYEIDTGYTYSSERLLNFLNNYLLDCMQEVERKESHLVEKERRLAQQTASKLADIKYADALSRANDAESKLDEISLHIEGIALVISGEPIHPIY